jgi:hypothetical protein
LLQTLYFLSLFPLTPIAPFSAYLSYQKTASSAFPAATTILVLKTKVKRSRYKNIICLLSNNNVLY